MKHIKLGLDEKSIKSSNALAGNIIRTRVTVKTIKNINPDVVLSFLTMVNIVTILSAKITSTPVIVSERTNINSLKSKFWKKVRRIVYPYADALIVQSKYDKNKYGFHKYCKVIQNPISITNNYNNIKRENIILAVGRLVNVKGFDLLIDAFSKVNSVNWNLIILGNGNNRKKLQKQIDDLNLKDKVKMPGVEKDIEKYYKKSSIFVLSSRLEGFPNALVEAMAYGCSPIAFDILTGPRDIIDNQKNGLLIEALNVSLLAQEMQKLMDNPDKIYTYGKNAKNITKKLDIEKISKEWFDIIFTILK